MGQWSPGSHWTDKTGARGLAQGTLHHHEPSSRERERNSSSASGQMRGEYELAVKGRPSLLTAPPGHPAGRVSQAHEAGSHLPTSTCALETTQAWSLQRPLLLPTALPPRSATPAPPSPLRRPQLRPPSPSAQLDHTDVPTVPSSSRPPSSPAAYLTSHPGGPDLVP